MKQEGIAAAWLEDMVLFRMKVHQLKRPASGSMTSILGQIWGCFISEKKSWRLLFSQLLRPGFLLDVSFGFPGKSSRRPNGQGSSTVDSYEKPPELRKGSKHVARQII